MDGSIEKEFYSKSIKTVWILPIPWGKLPKNKISSRILIRWDV